jgi:hypothetical protein
MSRTITSRTTIAQIRSYLREDGYETLVSRAAEIKAAAERGALLWGPFRLTTTDASRIDARAVETSPSVRANDERDAQIAAEGERYTRGSGDGAWTGRDGRH